MPLNREYSKLPVWLLRITRAEFLPLTIVYAIPFLYTLFQSLRLGRSFYPAALNPAIGESGGFDQLNKSSIMALFPSQYQPPSLSFSGLEQDSFLQEVNRIIGYPCFAKPEDQIQGIGVVKVESEAALRQYLASQQGPLLVQKALPTEPEYAVFICRLPGQLLHVTGITAKEFLAVTGDGLHSVREMLLGNIRYRMAKDKLEKAYPELLGSISAKGERVLVQPVGNHNLGTRFVDVTHLATPAMDAFFDTIVPEGICYGRFDMKAVSIDSLETGEGLWIIEFNGSIAEPVQYLDSKYNWWQAQRILLHHFRWQKDIGAAQYKRGLKGPGILEGIKRLRGAAVKAIEGRKSIMDKN